MAIVAKKELKTEKEEILPDSTEDVATNKRKIESGQSEEAAKPAGIYGMEAIKKEAEDGPGPSKEGDATGKK